MRVFSLLVSCSALWVVVSCDPDCDSTLEFSSDFSSWPKDGDGVHQRSLSPWTWRSTTDKTRIPSTLWEAECSSKSCSGPGPDQDQDQDLNSVPVYQSVLVLTPRGAGGAGGAGGCYTASQRSVAVGCTCIRARTLKD